MISAIDWPRQLARDRQRFIEGWFWQCVELRGFDATWQELDRLQAQAIAQQIDLAVVIDREVIE